MLTDNEIRRYDSLKNRPQKRLLLSDRGGLALDVLPSGVRSWVFRYRSKAGVRSKVTIARYPDLRLRAAREERDKLAAQVARGVSPAHEQKEQKREQRSASKAAGAILPSRNSRSAGIASSCCRRRGVTIAGILNPSAARSTTRSSPHSYRKANFSGSSVPPFWIAGTRPLESLPIGRLINTDLPKRELAGTCPR
jgi:hypothetical protein